MKTNTKCKIWAVIITAAIVALALLMTPRAGAIAVDTSREVSQLRDEVAALRAEVAQCRAKADNTESVLMAFQKSVIDLQKLIITFLTKKQ